MQNDPFEHILGQSAAAESIRAFGRRAAGVDASVLLVGESGTGKGILARAIHDASARARAPFVSVNCAAVPETLFESEFFGHVRGAFTGAQYSHKGLFEQANGGTLFLDEIGELPLTGQAKLLTAIEDREVRPVGAERVRQIRARILAATALDLENAVCSGTFRADLYHRLSVLSIRIPPLRERVEDIPEIAVFLLSLLAQRYSRPNAVFDVHAFDTLCMHTWPGNVRELSNVIEASLIICADNIVCIEDSLLSRSNLYEAAVPGENQRIAEALRRFNGNKTRAAAALGMGRTTLWQRLKHIDPKSFDSEQS